MRLRYAKSLYDEILGRAKLRNATKKLQGINTGDLDDPLIRKLSLPSIVMEETLQFNSKIDLAALSQNRDRRVRPSTFKILRMTVSFFKQSPASIDFGEFTDDASHYFSLFIGRNGVGKSLLLRAVLDFLIDARGPRQTTFNMRSPVTITSIEYIIDNVLYKISKDDNKWKYYKNNAAVEKEYIVFPFIVASTMGMFDKFPLNSIQGKSKNARYISDYYKYVGPKANNNMFTSKTNVLLQILSSLNDVEDYNQLRKIGKILKYIGYDSKIEFRFKLKDNVDELIAKRKEPLDDSLQNCVNRLKRREGIVKKHVLPDVDSSYQVRKRDIRSFDRLRQEKLLASCRCSLYKNGDTIDCNQLSSGEFNMLSIVLSVILNSKHQNLLILLDEPEISQHPNWQVGIIDKLDDALSDYGCHFLIATHCHYLVSNLPLKRSNLMMIEEKDGREIQIEPMPSETYGWSSEEVLLKVFGMATDRSRYLADIVGKRMTKIGNNDITPDDVKKEVNFLRQVSEGLSEVDPMKRIIDTIINEFSKDE